MATGTGDAVADLGRLESLAATLAGDGRAGDAAAVGAAVAELRRLRVCHGCDGAGRRYYSFVGLSSCLECGGSGRRD